MKRRSTTFVHALLGLALAAVSACAGAVRAPAPETAVFDSRVLNERCAVLAALRSNDFEIEAATFTSADRGSRHFAFCEVKVRAMPAAGSRIGIVVRMPVDWNGRLVGLGGGGLAGNVALTYGEDGHGLDALSRLSAGYSTVQTDTGHESPQPWDSQWALLPDGEPNWAGIEDFAYRAVHQANVVARQVIQTFYGSSPTYAYFYGCSTGGRQGLIEAQRFPEDYDGVVSGAPVYDQRVVSTAVRNARVFFAAGITIEQIGTINDAVLQACDQIDGLRDGIVGDPRQCRWDPAALRCEAGQTGASCLTDRQVTAMRSLYQSEQAPNGETAVFALPYGSERTALPKYLMMEGNFPAFAGLDNLRGAQFEDPNFNFDSWNPTRGYPQQSATRYARMLDAVDADISPFIQNGGRLILYHGLYDDAPNWMATLDYYRSMTELTGARLETHGATAGANTFARLFLVPGMGHCEGGPGADSFDLLLALEAWVEHGITPDRIVTRPTLRAGAATDSLSPVPTLSLPAGAERPLCAFPALPRYSSGDPLAASSFACVAPPT